MRSLCRFFLFAKSARALMAKKVWKEDRRNNFLLALFLEQGCRLYKESCTMKYKVKWIEDHMGITRNMIRRYEKKGVISKNEEGKDREFDEEGLRQLWDIRMLVSLGFSLDEVKEILSEGNLKELSQRKLGELDKKCEDLQSKKDVLNIVQITGELPCCLEDVIDGFGKKSE